MTSIQILAEIQKLPQIDRIAIAEEILSTVRKKISKIQRPNISIEEAVGLAMNDYCQHSERSVFSGVDADELYNYEKR